MKKGIDERGPIGGWLLASRLSMRDPGATRAWTVERFLEVLREETGWSPVRTTYARWESGAARPEPENLDRVAAFYAARDVEGPAGPQEPAPAPDLATALAALAAATSEMAKELAALREERGALASRVEDLEGQVDQLVRAARAERGTAGPQVLDAPGQ